MRAERASTLPRLPTTDAILRELERGAGDSFGARAAIGLYDPNARALRFDNGHGALPPSVPEGSRFLAARVFASQEAQFFQKPIVRASPPGGGRLSTATDFTRPGSTLKFMHRVLLSPLTL